jgi:glycerophosphodiester phosphodiesterase
MPFQLQVKEGIDAVIVDSVLAIRKGLTGPDANITTLPTVGLVGLPAVPTTPNGIEIPSIGSPMNGVPIYESGVLDGVHGAIFAR